MPTFRELCSDLQSELRANNIDDRYSYRFLSSRIKDKIRNFIKQDADNRRLLKLNDLWIVFPLMSMIEAPYIDYNVDIPDIRTLRKSKKKITKTFSTNYGDLLRVYTIGGDTEYHIIKKINYKDILNLEFRDKRIKYAWIENDYLYIPDSDVEEVKIVGFPENPEDLSCEVCIKPLDTELPFPGYLIDIVKKDIIGELIGTKRIIPDDNPNQNSSIKT